MTNLRPALAALAACVLFTSLAHGGGPALATWEGAGTIVTSFNVIGGPITVADNGAVACIDADDDGDHESGRGGACIAFEDVSGDSLLVTDDEHGTDIAFQVCVDVNGDGICGLVGGGDANGDGIPDVFADNDGDGVPDGFNAPCSDRLVFSHGSGGDFSNPLLLPANAESLWNACSGGNGFAGYVVITCAGLHRDFDDVAAHEHQVTAGTVEDATGGGASGDFCGGVAPQAAKAYVLE